MKRRRGFALVLTVALLALLVLLVVALASLTRVETSVARNVGAGVQARQNALAGLHVALGRLQAAAGPDRRITANADVLAATSLAPHPGNTQWCGVWDSAAPAGTPLGWLVSGAGPSDHTLAPPAVGGGATAGVRLVGNASSDVSIPGNEVVVRRESLEVSAAPGLVGPATLGRFAFWIGDEGVKGNVGVIDRVAEIPVPAGAAADDPIRSADERDRVRQLLAHRSGSDALNFFGAPYGLQLLGERDAVSAARWSAFGRALDDGQLRFQTLATSGAETDYRRFLRRDFHALTIHSRGLLTDTNAGGLRVNWSDPAAAPVEWRDLDSSKLLPGDRLAVSPGHAAIGQPAAQVKPIVTEFALDFVPYRDATADGAPTGRLLLGVRLRVELWNPFNLPLAQTPAGAADYVFAVPAGLPVVAVTAPAQPAPSVGALSLPALLSAGFAVPVDCAGDLAAGETVVCETVVTTGLDTGLAVADATPTDPADDNLQLSVAPEATRALSWELRRAAPAAGEAPLTVGATFPSPGWTRSAGSGWSVPGNAPFAAAAPLRDRGVSFHFRLDSGRTRWGDWVVPPAGRAPATDVRASFVEHAAGAWESVAADPVENARNAARMFSAAELFAAGKTRRVCDASVQRNLSLGALAQVATPGERFAPAGQPWGGARNAVFDAAFLSPAPAGWVTGDRLPNPRHRALAAVAGATAGAAELRGRDAARWLAVDGMFNVNSTSADAWTLLLGRAVLDWRDSAGVARDLENPFVAFPHTAGWARSPQRGRREFSDATVQQLAAAIRTRLQQRGRPFGSLAEWLNSGLLQTAIDDAGLNTSPAHVADLGAPPPAYEPDFLTQATVLQTLAPFVAVRSDTFRVRAYGEVVNPATAAVEGRAWCEAIVQRFPERVDGGATMSDAAGYGRRFSVVAFRWLNEAEL